MTTDPQTAAGRWMAIGAVNALLAVAAGAYGAHGLTDIELQRIFETGVRYHMWHALGMVLAGVMIRLRGAGQGARFAWAAGAFAVGMVLFSLNLYILGATGDSPFRALAPIGGMAFMVGWGLFAWGALSRD